MRLFDLETVVFDSDRFQTILVETKLEEEHAFAEGTSTASTPASAWSPDRTSTRCTGASDARDRAGLVAPTHRLFHTLCNIGAS